MTTAVPPCFTRASRRRAFESTAILRRCHGRTRLRLSRNLGGAALRPCSAPPSAPHHTSRGSLRRISELTLLFTAFMVAFHFPTSITAPAFFVKLEQKAKKAVWSKILHNLFQVSPSINSRVCYTTIAGRNRTDIKKHSKNSKQIRNTPIFILLSFLPMGSAPFWGRGL